MFRIWSRFFIMPGMAAASSARTCVIDPCPRERLPGRLRDPLDLFLASHGVTGQVALRGQGDLVGETAVDRLRGLVGGGDRALSEVPDRDTGPARRRGVHGAGHRDATELEAGDLLAGSGVLD